MCMYVCMYVCVCVYFFFFFFFSMNITLIHNFKFWGVKKLSNITIKNTCEVMLHQTEHLYQKQSKISSMIDSVRNKVFFVG